MAKSMTEKEVHDAFDEVIVGLEAGTEGTASAQPKVVLKSREGHLVDVDSLNVSENVKQLLKEVDAEGNGSVDDENVADMIHVVGMMKSFFGKGGKMSHSEIENGLGLLQRLVKEKDMNSGEMSYGHLPECIKEVMSEWDMDRSGSVNVLELSAAAKAHKKVKEEGRMMKRIIGGLFAVILILLIGMLVMSYLAVEMAKEMRGNSDGVMQTNDGQVVKVASSAFDVNADGTMVSREGAGSTLQVAQSKPKRQLSSTIPDDVLKKLDMVSLKQGDHFVQLKVNGMQRIQTKTSKCGSVVEFKTVEGVLTVDDYSVSADDQLAGYLQQAGMANVLADGVFGRRLSAGFLDGFFTQLEDMEWECTSVALPRPEDIPKTYEAKFQVTELVSNQKDKDASKSAFQSSSGDALIAGVMKHGDQIYRSWSEDVLKLGNLRISARKYAMHPLQSQLDIEMNDGGEAFVDQMGDTGHNCRLGSSLISNALESMISKATGLRLVGLVHENGMVLRKWRMEVKENLMTDTMSQSVINQGFVPEMTLDYFDVDTDPTEKFESGYPYRIHLLSTDGNTNVTLQYLEMAPVTDMDLAAALTFKGITKLSATCEMDQGLPNPAAFVSLGEELDKLVVASTDQVPRIEPWVEYPGVVKYTSDKLKELVQLSSTSPELQLARASMYWKSVMSNVNHQELLTNLANSNIENGDTTSERALAEGVTLKTEVEYTTDSNSLPGGIKKIKVIAEGTRLWPETGTQVPINGELEISVASRGARPYAKSCSTSSATMSLGALSGESFPVDVMMCLSEEFDYINFKVLIQNGNLSPGAWHFFMEESNFAQVNSVSRSRELCPVPFWGTLFCSLSWR